MYICMEMIFLIVRTNKTFYVKKLKIYDENKFFSSLDSHFGN